MYHVSVEWIFDSEQYNEWMNEEDYELDDNGRRKSGDMDMTYDELEASGEPRAGKNGKAKLGSKRKRSPSPTPKKKKGGSKSKKSKNNDYDEDNQTADVASKAEKYDILMAKVECPVCLAVPTKGPMASCLKGHLVCLPCHQRMVASTLTNCPTCREPM